MKLDFDQTLKNLDGLDLQDDEKNPIKLKTICVNALLGGDPREQTPGEEKAKRYDLALRLHKGGEQDVKVEEASLIKKQVGALYPAIIVGPVFSIFDA